MKRLKPLFGSTGPFSESSPFPARCFCHNSALGRDKSLESKPTMEADLRSKGVQFSTETQGESGPTHFVMKDPDGNVIMFDQHTA